MSTCILVVGIHRSGTSSVAGTLHNMGISMGKQFLPPLNENKKGYFEDLQLMRMQDGIIGNWKNPTMRQHPGLLQRYKLMIKERSLQPIWGFKDPRTALTIRLIMPHILEVDDDPFIYACFRRPDKIADSLNRRQGTPHDFGLVIAREYNMRLLNFLWDFCEIER